MSEKTVLNCDMCLHTHVCKIKDEYKNFTRESVPNYILADYQCLFWIKEHQYKPKKMPNFNSTDCDCCIHKDICCLKNRIEEAMRELRQIRSDRQIIYQGIAITAKCRDYEPKPKE